MRIRDLMFLGLLLPVCTACGRNAPDTAMRRDRAAPGPEEPADAWQGSGNAVELVGVWELRSTPPQRFPGLQIAIRVDSAADFWYFGRLANYFSGNVGRDPNDYEAFADSISTAREVTFVIEAADGGMPGMRFGGTLGADTILLDTFVLGPDTLSGRTRRWFLVRGA